MKNKKILFGLLLIFIFITSVSLTYAYFSVEVSGNDQVKLIKTSTGRLEVTYNGGEELIAEEVYPGWTQTKTISVTNTGTFQAFYSIEFADLVNTIINDELVISATCTGDSCAVINEQPVGNINGPIVSNIELSIGETHTYTITFTFLETGSVQDYNQNKSFSGKIIIGSSEDILNELNGIVVDAYDNPISNATVTLHSEPQTTTTDENGKFLFTDIPVGNHTINVIDSGNSLLNKSLKLASGKNNFMIGNVISKATSTNSINVKVVVGNDNDSTIEMLPRKFKKIKASAYNVLALDEDNNLWTWGANNYGQAGTGKTVAQTNPTRIMYGTKFNTIAGNGGTVFAIDVNGNLYGWGYNLGGTVGDGTKITRLSPINISQKLNGLKFISVSSYNHTLAIDENHNLWGWGTNTYGELGNGTTSSTKVLSPINISNLLDGKQFDSVSVGANFSVALDTNGKLWTWGKNNVGQLGDGTMTNSSSPINISSLNSDKVFTSITTGKDSAFAIDTTGNLWGWGQNNYYQLGTTNLQYTFSTELIQVMNGTKIVDVSAGMYHSHAIDENNNLYSWGYNLDYRLGDGTTNNSNEPIEIIPGTNFVNVSAGFGFSVALDTNGFVWTWGANNVGQLGNGKGDYETTPSLLNTQEKFSSKSLKGFRTLATNNNGDIVMIGGTNPATNYSSILSNVNEVSNGFNHNLAIDTDGNLWAWGNNYYGQLGNASTIDSTTPINISQLLSNRKFSEISAGYYYSLAIDTDGNLWAWGYNYYGQLGNATTVNSTTPVNITTILGGKRFSKISNSYMNNYSYGIDVDGILYAWGTADNQFKPLDDFCADCSYTFPYNISQFMDNILFEDVIVGGYHTLAIDSEGNLWSWGYNGFGQFGNGETSSQGSSQPVNISALNGDKKFIDAAPGEFHTLAIDEDGYLWSMGKNNYGQLGNGTTIDSLIPIKVDEINTFTNVSAINHSIAIDTNGRAWVWGLNQSAYYIQGFSQYNSFNPFIKYIY